MYNSIETIFYGIIGPLLFYENDSKHPSPLPLKKTSKLYCVFFYITVYSKKRVFLLERIHVFHLFIRV